MLVLILFVWGLPALEASCEQWTLPLNAVDSQTAGIRADNPDGPCDWMYCEGRKVRRPFGKDVKSSPKKSFEELNKGDFKYFGSVCFCFCFVSSSHPSMPSLVDVFLHLHTRPKIVVPGTCENMAKQLRKTNAVELKELLLSDGILESDGDGVRFVRKRWEETWGSYCLCWYNKDQPVRCTCWSWAWRSTCPHMYAAQEYWKIREWVGLRIRLVPKAMPYKQRMLTMMILWETPSRERRR